MYNYVLYLYVKGLAFCGTIGSSLRREYALVGDTVNTSARLMGAAMHMDKTDILCCGLTVKEVTAWFGKHPYSRKINFTQLPSVQLKGKPTKTEIFVPNYQNEDQVAIKYISDQVFFFNFL